MSSPDEKLLLQEIREGSNSAFATFYKQNFAIIKSFVIRYVKCSDLAEDLSQEIFIKIWEKRSNIPELDSVRSYLFVIARNHTFTFLKKAAAEQHLKEHITSSLLTSATITEDHLISDEYARHLKMMIGTLPSQTQRVFKMCREEEKSYNEVSRLLGISKDAVKKHMVRSMKILKPILSGLFTF